MADRITEQERQAIRSYVTGGGVVTRCPDGEAMFARYQNVLGGTNCTIVEHLAALGLVVVPIRAEPANMRPQERNNTLEVTTLLKIAA